MNQALRQLPLSAARLVENYRRLQYELGDFIEGLPVINARRGLVSLVVPACQTIEVLMDFWQMLWGEGEILHMHDCTDITSICHSFEVSKQCKVILVV